MLAFAGSSGLGTHGLLTPLSCSVSLTLLLLPRLGSGSCFFLRVRGAGQAPRPMGPPNVLGLSGRAERGPALSLSLSLSLSLLSLYSFRNLLEGFELMHLSARR